MVHSHRLAAIALSLVTACAAFAQSGGTYPSKPLRLITGSSDILPRVLAQGLTSRLGQQIIVDNRGAGLVAIDAAAKAVPDGYTYLLFGNSLWLAPLMQSTAFDPFRDFVPVSLATSAPAVLVVPPYVPAKSLKELIALAKAKPGSLNYGSGGAGSTSHLSAELLKSMANIDVVRVPYKGTIQAATATMAGEVQLFFATLGAIDPAIKAAKVRVLAITSAQPSVLAPGIPTVAAVLPGYEFTQIQGVFAPANTPAQFVSRVQQEVAAVLGQAEVKEQFRLLGTDAIGTPPEALAQAMKADITRLGKVIKEGRITLD